MAKQLWFGMKLTADEKASLKRLAARDGTSVKEAILRLVSRELDGTSTKAPAGSFLAGIEHLVGSVIAAEDLSTSRRHLADFGAD